MSCPICCRPAKELYCPWHAFQHENGIRFRAAQYRPSRSHADSFPDGRYALEEAYWLLQHVDSKAYDLVLAACHFAATREEPPLRKLFVSSPRLATLYDKFHLIPEYIEKGDLTPLLTSNNAGLRELGIKMLARTES